MRSKGSSLTLNSHVVSAFVSAVCSSFRVMLHSFLSRSNSHQQFIMVRARQCGERKNVCNGTRSLFSFSFFVPSKTSSTTRALGQEVFSQSSFCAIDCKETHFAMFLPLFIACYPRQSETERKRLQVKRRALYMHFPVPHSPLSFFLFAVARSEAS